MLAQVGSRSTCEVLTRSVGLAVRRDGLSGDGFRYEAMELRDGDKGVYLGNSVKRAVKNINEKISEALIGMDPILQAQIDQAMIDLDKTEKKVCA